MFVDNSFMSFKYTMKKSNENVKMPVYVTVTPTARFFEVQLLARTGCFLIDLSTKNCVRIIQFC